MTTLIIIKAIAFLGMIATYWIGRFGERNKWAEWAMNEESDWPAHLSKADLSDLEDTPTPNEAKTIAYTLGFEDGITSRKRIAAHKTICEQQTALQGEPLLPDHEPSSLKRNRQATVATTGGDQSGRAADTFPDQIEVADQAAS